MGSLPGYYGAPAAVSRRPVDLKIWRGGCGVALQVRLRVA